MSSVDIATELAKATKVKEAKYTDRQDYLAALVRAVGKMSNTEYDTLSDEAVDWVNHATQAMNNRNDIPEFDEESDEPIEDDEPEADDETSEGSEEPEHGSDEDPAEPEAEPDGAAESEEAEEGADEVPDEAEEAEAPAKKRGRPKKEKVAKPPKAAKAAKPKADKPKGVKVEYTKLTGEKDRFGITAGTKVSMAVELFEKGATANEVDEKIGGRFYNILRDLVKAGHLLEKQPGNILKLTHMDDVAVAKARKK